MSIDAYGFLPCSAWVASVLPSRTVEGKNVANAQCLRFPRVTSRAAVQRTQRHVSSSIMTLRHQLGAYLMLELCHCSSCGSCMWHLRL
ncbi:hypothetical protein [Azotobacter armeniacus]